MPQVEIPGSYGQLQNHNLELPVVGRLINDALVRTAARGWYVHNGCNWLLTSEIISGNDADMQLHMDTSQMGLTQVIPLDLMILVVPTITCSLIHRWCWGWL